MTKLGLMRIRSYLVWKYGPSAVLLFVFLYLLFFSFDKTLESQSGTEVAVLRRRVAELGAEVLSLKLDAALSRQPFPEEVTFLINTWSSLHETPLILLEPHLLSAISNYYPPDKFSLAVGRDVTTFAIFENQISMLEKLRPVAESHGYKVATVSQSDPRLLSDTQTSARKITTHVLLKKGQKITQISVFYLRKGSYFWHGGVTAAELPKGFNQVTTSSVFTVERAFDKFDVIPATIGSLQGKISVPSNPRKLLWELPASRFLECNYHVVGEFFKRNPQTPRKGPHDAKILKGFSHIKEKMNKLEKRIFLFSGSILGWYRQCGIIPYTSDVDFGAWVSEYEPAIFSAFRRNRVVKLRRRFGWVNDSLEFQLYHEDIQMDIFFVFKATDTTYTGGYRGEDNSKVRSTYPMFKVCSCELLGIRLNIPCNPVGMIEAEYGESWQSPKREWDWSHSPSNVAENGIWEEDQLEAAIQIFND